MTRHASAMPFPLWVSHHPEEPAYSILRRTLERNAIPHPGLVYASLGRKGAMSATSIGTDVVAHLCRVDPVSLARATPMRTGPMVELFGQRLATNDVSVRKGRRWCPCCMGEAGVHRSWWDIQPITCCPRHRRELADRCSCGRTLSWWNERISVCPCGLDLADATTLEVSASEARVSGFILGKLLGEPTESIALFEGVDLAETIDVMRRLGSFAIDAWSALDQVVEEKGEASVLSLGMDAAQDFPTSFRAALDVAMENAEGRPGSSGIGRSYGLVLVNWLKRKLATKTGALVAAEVRDHAKGRVLRREGAKMLGQTVAGARVSVLEASKQCGLSFDRMRRIATARGLISPRSEPRARMTISIAELEAIKLDLESYVGSTEVAKQLGLKHEEVLRLVEAGHVPTAHPPREIMRVQTVDAFRRDAAEELLRRLGKGRLPEGAPPGSLKFTRAAIAINVGTCELVGLVLAGRIQPVAYDESTSGIQSIRIAAKGWRARLRRDRMGLLTAQEFAGIVGCHMDVVSRLTLVGAIPSREVGRFRMLTRADGDAFFAAHCTPTQAAELLRTSVRDAPVFLRERGVEAAWRQSEVGRWFYRRDDVERLAASLID